MMPNLLRLRWQLGLLPGCALLAYAGLWFFLVLDARQRLAQPLGPPADVALVFGNRAYLNGQPNPCLTGRVDAAVALVRSGQVRRLLFSGGVDREDGRIEADVMASHARAVGYTGRLLREQASQSTRENLSYSRELLRGEGVRRVVLVSEPYHLWRIEKLAQASGFAQTFELQYAAAPTQCWRQWGMFFKGALREPLAIAHNAWHGYF